MYTQESVVFIKLREFTSSASNIFPWRMTISADGQYIAVFGDVDAFYVVDVSSAEVTLIRDNVSRDVVFAKQHKLCIAIEHYIYILDISQLTMGATYSMFWQAPNWALAEGLISEKGRVVALRPFPRYVPVTTQCHIKRLIYHAKAEEILFITYDSWLYKASSHWTALSMDKVDMLSQVVFVDDNCAVFIYKRSEPQMVDLVTFERESVDSDAIGTNYFCIKNAGDIYKMFVTGGPLQLVVGNTGAYECMHIGPDRQQAVFISGNFTHITRFPVPVPVLIFGERASAFRVTSEGVLKKPADYLACSDTMISHCMRVAEMQQALPYEKRMPPALMVATYNFDVFQLGLHCHGPFRLRLPSSIVRLIGQHMGCDV